MNNIIRFARLNKKAKIPTKREGDGCYDIYACLDEPEVFAPNEIRLVPTGICSAFPSSYRIGIRERGSNTKTGLQVMAGQIDSNFRGEWFVALHNATDEFVTIKPDSKAIAQFAVEFVPDVNIVEVAADGIINDITERGAGCLGSSGK